MAKQYYIKKDPSVSGPDIEWLSINGKEFYQLVTSAAGRGRYFIDMDEFMIESTEAEYKEWRKERDHSDYLHEQEYPAHPLQGWDGDRIDRRDEHGISDSISPHTNLCLQLRLVKRS